MGIIYPNRVFKPALNSGGNALNCLVPRCLLTVLINLWKFRKVDCEKVYLGQTKCQFCTRPKEHQRAVSNFNSSKSALAEHVRETRHNIAWEDFRIITTNNRYGQRLCVEAWHINAILVP